MRPLRVVTWNVLHRVHAVNWNEAPVVAFPDERVRVARISDVVARWLADGVDVVCLQEVSGDQLASVGRAVAGVRGVQVFEHLYPRVPRLRDGGASPLDDPREHLVVLAMLPSARLEGRTFDSDPGKGFLAVDVGDGITVVDTHVSFGKRRVGQLAALAAAARERAVVVGDFNVEPEVVAESLGAPFSVCDLHAPTHGAKAIDHVVVRGGTIASVALDRQGGLSDHEPVRAVVHFG